MLIFSRQRHDFTKRFARIAPLIASLPARNAIIDAELVACDDSGQPNFKLLMSAGKGTRTLCCWCFDLLRLDGENLQLKPLSVRRAKLFPLIAAADEQGLQMSLDFEDGAILLDRANEMGLEGIVSKRQASIYRSGRTKDWLKIKTPTWIADNSKRGELFRR